MSGLFQSRWLSYFIFSGLTLFNLSFGKLLTSTHHKRHHFKYNSMYNLFSRPGNFWNMSIFILVLDCIKLQFKHLASSGLPLWRHLLYTILPNFFIFYFIYYFKLELHSWKGYFFKLNSVVFDLFSCVFSGNFLNKGTLKTVV